MAIVDIENPGVEILQQVAQQQSLSFVMNETHQALTQLRFHEGLRRGWAEAREEAAVREATALAQLSGVKISVDELRQLSLMDEASSGLNAVRSGLNAIGVDRGSSVSADPGVAVALGIWRSQVDLVERMEPLNVRQRNVGVRTRSVAPLPALISGFHRDICSALVATGRISSNEVAIPQNAEDLLQALRYAQMKVPVLVRAAALVALFRVRSIFQPEGGAVGAVLARHLITSEGTDPTGVAVISAADAIDPAAASSAIAGWVTGDVAGVTRWVEHFCQSVAFGARLGGEVARSVQAGIIHTS